MAAYRNTFKILMPKPVGNKMLGILRHFGVRNGSLEIIRSYLNGHEQTIKLNGNFFYFINVTSRVPHDYIFYYFDERFFYNVPSCSVLYTDDTDLLIERLSSYTNK